MPLGSMYFFEWDYEKYKAEHLRSGGGLHNLELQLWCYAKNQLEQYPGVVYFISGKKIKMSVTSGKAFNDQRPPNTAYDSITIWRGI